MSSYSIASLVQLNSYARGCITQPLQNKVLLDVHMTDA